MVCVCTCSSNSIQPFFDFVCRSVSQVLDKLYTFARLVNEQYLLPIYATYKRRRERSIYHVFQVNKNLQSHVDIHVNSISVPSKRCM